MKKRILTLLCVIACVLGLAACGNETEYSSIQMSKIAQAEEISDTLVNLTQNLGTEDTLEALSEYRKHETAAILSSYASLMNVSVEAEYGVFEGMLNTYVQANEDMGGITAIGNRTSKVVGKEIVVTYDITGNKANGTFKFEFTNDVFTKLTAAEATAKLSFADTLSKAGSQMGKAGLNTLLGMGTVFVVLILISLIISSFSLFGKANKPAPKVEEPKKQTSLDPVEEDLADDTELVAVIMAAISAYEGNASTDGYVVRSIRRANRRN